MLKSISGQRNLVARIFLGGLLFGSVGGLAQHAWGAWRTYPADSHCVKDPSATVGWVCGTNLGNDFLASALNTVEIDYLLSNQAADTTRAYACRDSWNLTTSSCGAATTESLNINATPVVKNTYVSDLTVIKAGSTFDYRYVAINASKANTVIDPKGVYLSAP